MTADRETLEVYNARAGDYAQTMGRDPAATASLQAFVARLPKGGRVLDLGCGPGSWAQAMLEMGFEVEATDASDAMVAEASKVEGLKVRKAVFEDIDDVARYDGIWANFSLLHAPRAAMPGHLARLHRALKPGGVLHIGLKEGTGEKRDRLGRFYTYYTVAELTGLLAALDMVTDDLREGADKGLDGEVAGWFTLTARKILPDADTDPDTETA
ncbi:bifunctional 2-polyprenyl-6-hydroxyphenol methylase/3-demethylubiquinol 3-O-methyltransferase UbiG [Sagittula sp. P11]|uniref:class I SAM-dependent methyltransferase n=1 Tax=Sagittula sp. P11 TaxID=2009329 RepID=UPI0018E1DDF5|nr:class I SAM-dependent methyltransferase [Sagittula sp. P11]